MRRMPADYYAGTLGDLLKRLGGINPRRVRLTPSPSKATERDLIRVNERGDRIYELVEGALVEKVMGYGESSLTCRLIMYMGLFLEEHDFGVLSGESGGTRLMTGLVRMPDVSFVSWDRLPVRGQKPDEPILGVVPDLAVEVLSKGNTKREMLRKLKEYFLAGVRVVWFVDPRRATVTVYTAPDQFVVLSVDQTLDGGDVLPGFTLALRDLFTGAPGAKTSQSRRTPNGKRKGGRG